MTYLHWLSFEKCESYPSPRKNVNSEAYPLDVNINNQKNLKIERYLDILTLELKGEMLYRDGHSLVKYWERYI